MSELVPAADAQGVAVSLSPQPAPSLFAPLTDPAGGPAFTRVRSFAAQPPVKRMVPWFAGVSAVGLAAVAWLALSPAPQRVLYAELDDANRATVTEALDKAGITYAIDNSTGATPDFMARLEKTYGKDITTRTWLTVQRVVKKMES